ncbi:FAD-dependent oxidoreductase [Pseudomonas sp. NA13]
MIGGGLAGCASAASLAARGWQVTLLERHAGLAEEASGNPRVCCTSSCRPMARRCRR